MRTCGNCGADISKRAPQARFCADAACQRERGRVHGRESWARIGETVRASRRAKYAAAVAVQPKRQISCAHCGTAITHKAGRAKWCNTSCREKARHAANPARARHKAATWRALNPERSRELTDRWRALNRDRYLDQTRRAHQKRRAWKLASPGNGISARAWHRLLTQYSGRCAYCSLPAPEGEQLTMEHIVPLSRGGSHAEGNLVPACSSCNLSKSDRLLIEWRAGRRIGRKRPASATRAKVA